jgi:uncharacterized surface protein with fasciclin (FAS1) repeats
MKTIIRRLISSCSIIPVATFIAHQPLEGAEKTIASFGSENSLNSWISVNDGVMGGVSKGGFELSEKGTMLFTGELSLANNGGFASIRMKPGDLGLEGTSGVLVKARGDGRTYWVDLRVSNQMAASSYRAYLPTTSGEWKETSIPYANFKLQAVGRSLPSKQINPADVVSVGFTLSDKKEGPFSLEIENIKATVTTIRLETKGSNTLADVAKAAGQFKTLLAAAEAAGLLDALTGDGPLTVLAPTDDAFAKLPEGTVESLLLSENRDQLAAILKNHVIAGSVTLAKALEAGEAAPLQGTAIAFRFENGRVMVGNAAMLKANIEASNGIIHVIDQVLLSKTKANQPLKPSELIELAIARGVPVFNDGNTAECAAIYEITVQALRAMSALSEESRSHLADAINAAEAESSDRKRAWILRGALDVEWKTLNGGH